MGGRGEERVAAEGTGVGARDEVGYMRLRDRVWV